MDQVELATILHSSDASAKTALTNLGAELLEDLSGEVEFRGVGMVRRHFGLVGNLLQSHTAIVNPALWTRLQPLVDDEDNDKLRDKMSSGRVNYMPMSKRAVKKVLPDLHTNGVHLPWAFKPMNFDFAAKLPAGAFPFKAFYSQNITADAASGMVTAKRIFSLPLMGAVQGTFQEPIFDALLDEDVGLFIEANVRL